MNNLNAIQLSMLTGGFCILLPGNTENRPFGECFNSCLLAEMMSNGNSAFEVCLL